MLCNKGDSYAEIRESLWQDTVMPLLIAVEREARTLGMPLKWEMVVGNEVLFMESDGEGNERRGRRQKEST